VFVPYPGKYIEFDVRVDNAKVNEKIFFTIDGINRGNETIHEAQFIITIHDPAGNIVKSLVTDKKTMQPNEKAQFIGEWLASGVSPGRYNMVIEASYDGIRHKKNMAFMIGSPNAKIVYVNVNPITNKAVGRITANVVSEWNERINGMSIMLSFKKEWATYQAAGNSFDMEPFGEANISIFWDTADSDGPGKYEGLAVLKYLNNTHNATFQIEVVEAGLFGMDQQTTTMLLVIVIAVLVAFPVVILFLRKRGGKKFEQKKLM